MRWMKANQQLKKEQKAPGKKGNNYQKAGKAADKSNDNRTVVVFNPLLWKEEIVNLLEDWIDRWLTKPKQMTSEMVTLSIYNLKRFVRLRQDSNISYL